MAEWIRESESLVLKLSTAEKMEGLHGDIRVPVTAVESVAVLEDAMAAVHGVKVLGSRLPGAFAMGTFISGEGKIFAMVHHHTKRGVKIRLTGQTYRAVIVGMDDPERVVLMLPQSRE